MGVRPWRQGWSPADSLGSPHLWKVMCSPWRIQLILRCVSKTGELVVLMMVFGVYCLSLLATEWESNLEIRGTAILDMGSGKPILGFGYRCNLRFHMAQHIWEGTKSL